MKHTPQPEQVSLYDDYFVRQLVPSDHPLLLIDREVDFSFVRDLVADCYSPDSGREAADPELLLRLCFLESYCGLSDREVVARAQTDLAFRVFLHLGLEAPLPHPSLLSVFRTRLGEARFREVFNRSVGMAVERGLVPGRLVIVDSFSVVADLAVPRLRKLLMRVVRSGLLVLAKQGLDVAALAAEQTTRSEDSSWWQSKELREKDLQAWFGLAKRVEAALQAAPEGPAPRRVLRLLKKALERQAKPKPNERRDRLVSDVDPDARWSVRACTSYTASWA